MRRLSRFAAAVATALAAAMALGGTAVRADDDRPAPPAAPQPASGSAADPMAEAVRALRVRMEARLEEARLLEKQGQTEKAIEALRSVDDLFRQGMDEFRAILRSGAPDETLPARREPVGAPSGPPVDGATALADALAWLATHQASDGRWEAAGFMNWCDGHRVAGEGRPDGAGNAGYDVGVTALAALAFLDAGVGLDASSPHREVLSRALGYLKSVQDPEGCVGPRTSMHFIYDHALATIVLVEAYATTGSALWRESAQRALDFLAMARNPYLGWRYGVRTGDNDTSVTAWAVTALHAAKVENESALRAGKTAPFSIDDEAFVGARAWVDKMTDPATGRVGYIQRGSAPARPQELVDRFPPDKSEAMTAAGLLVRLDGGETIQQSPPMRAGLSLLAARPPRWNDADGSVDMYYWYLGTLAAYRAGGEDWRAWDRALRDAVLPHQRRDGDACGSKGSWDPVGPWGRDGGRVYSTAILALALEVSERYARSGR